MVTRPKLIAPFQMALGMWVTLRVGQDKNPQSPHTLLMMLLKRAVLDSIVAGDVDLAFRRWKRPSVRTGGTLRTAVGMLQIEEVEPVSMGDITEVDARRAGMSLGELVDLLNQKTEGEVYRVQLGRVVPDPRVTLREDDHLSEEDLAEIARKLNRLDGTSVRGPWTRQFLHLLAKNPHVKAQDLADRMGLEKAVFKNDVRKLEALGLTISHSPGYEVSPRGKALLRLLDETGS